MHACKIEKLAIKTKYNAENEFEKFEDVFTLVKEEDIAYFKEKAKQIMSIFLD